MSNKNIIALKESGYTFILGARIKSESKPIKDYILGLRLRDGQISKIDKPDGTSLFVKYSNKRARKDLSNRQRGLKCLEKNLNSGKLTKNNINNRGYNKYLKFQGELKIYIDYDKF